MEVLAATLFLVFLLSLISLLPTTHAQWLLKRKNKDLEIKLENTLKLLNDASKRNVELAARLHDSEKKYHMRN